MGEPLTPCLFGPKHEPFYCRIHGDVRLSLTDERCRTAVRTAAAPPEGSIQCPMCGGSGWLVKRKKDKPDCRHCADGTPHGVYRNVPEEARRG